LDAIPKSLIVLSLIADPAKQRLFSVFAIPEQGGGKPVPQLLHICVYALTPDFRHSGGFQARSMKSGFPTSFIVASVRRFSLAWSTAPDFSLFGTGGFS